MNACRRSRVGVADAATFEPDNHDLEPDCIVCRRVAHAKKVER